MRNADALPVHTKLYADRRFYSAHPHLAVAADGTWLLVFTQAPREPIVLHPPLEPRFRNMMMRSADEGRTWTAPEPVPDHETAGVECAGLTALPDGSVLLNQWQFGWIDPNDPHEQGDADVVPPQELARAWEQSREFAGLHEDVDPAVARRCFRLARNGGRCRISLAGNGRSRFEDLATIETGSFSGGYGMRGGVVLPAGDILLPLCDVPRYRQAFVVRSVDGGRNWGPPVTMASHPGAEFEEPAPVLLDNGEILVVLRENVSRLLHTVRSRDGGRNWSSPQATDIADYPADVIQLQDGRLVLVAGRRRRPFGITLHISCDRGRSWSEPVFLRDDLPDPDLGYPTIARRADGDLVVVYYARERDVTGLHFALVEARLINEWGPAR